MHHISLWVETDFSRSEWHFLHETSLWRHHDCSRLMPDRLETSLYKRGDYIHEACGFFTSRVFGGGGTTQTWQRGIPFLFFKLNSSITQNLNNKVVSKETSKQRKQAQIWTTDETLWDKLDTCESSREPASCDSTNLFSFEDIQSHFTAQVHQKVSGGGGGRRSRPSSPQTSGGDASGGFISHQKQRVKPRADPAATQGPDASSTRQYLFIYNHS